MEQTTKKINEMKSLYEKSTPGSKDNIDSRNNLNKLNITKSETVSNKINMYQSQLVEFEKDRISNKFSDITKKFGMYSLLNSAESTKDLPPNVSKELEKIRSNIINTHENDFQSRIGKFETKKDQNTGNHSNQISGFVQETHKLVEQYEKEIDFLRNKLAEFEKGQLLPIKKSIGFESLDIENENSTFEIPSDPKITFMKKMENLTSNDPSLGEISIIYNDKISELFDENEKLQIQLKQQPSVKEKVEFEKKLSELNKIIKKKDSEITNINDMYTNKLQDIFQENSSLMNQVEELKNSLKENELKYLTEIKTVSDIIVKDEVHLKEKDDKIKKFENEKKLQVDKILQLEEELMTKEEKISKYKHENEKLEIELKEFDKEIKSLKNIIEEKDIDKTLLKETLENKIHQKEKEIAKLKDQKIRDDSELNNNLLNKKNDEIKDYLEKISDLEKKMNKKDLELDDLKNIITKDQLKLKELSEFKSKGDNDTKEINRLACELVLIKQACEKEIEKVEESQKIQKELEDKNQLLQGNIVKYEKIIGGLKVILNEKDKNINLLTSDLAKFTMSNKEERIENKFDNLLLTRELIIDNLFQLYLYANSINIHQIVELVLNNYSLYMNSIFLRKQDQTLSFSMIHEFLEDLYFKIYDVCIKRKIQALGDTINIVNNNNTSYNQNVKRQTLFSVLTNNKSNQQENDLWIISNEDLNSHVLKEICEEIAEKNLISLVNSINQNEKSLDDIVEIFFNKYDKMFDSVENTFSDYLNNEIKPIVSDKIRKHQKSQIDLISTLLGYSISHIHSGKLIYNNKQLYDFKNFANEYISRGNKQIDTLYLNHNISNSETLDNILFTIRSGYRELNSIYFHGVVNGNSEYPFGKISMAIMLNCYTLQNLSITNCKLNEENLLFIVKLIEFLKHLKFLDLTGNNLQDSGIQVIAESLKTNKNITSIYLSNNKIGTNGGFYLADALIKNQTLEKLCLSCNMINESGLSSLLNVLTNHNHSLKFLDLSDNSLVFSDFKSIAELIESNPKIGILNISNNSIDPPGANYLGLALKNNTRLSVFYIQNANLNDESAPLLIKNLAGSKLSEIYLDGNPLGEIGTIIFANILKQNNFLKFVSFKTCDLTPMSLIVLLKIIALNTTLEGINLEKNMFDEQSVALLVNLLNNKNLRVYLTSQFLTNKSKELIKNIANIILN